jgi:DNA uptake protein ComE-like DNA-binding protein
MRIKNLLAAIACSAALALPAFAQTAAPAPATTTAAPPSAPATSAPAASVPLTPPTTRRTTSASQAATSASPTATAPATKTTATAAKVVGPFSINTASQADLIKLPQIGKVRSAKIIANRPYKSTSELVSKKVISQSTYDKIKDMITL